MLIILAADDLTGRCVAAPRRWRAAAPLCAGLLLLGACADTRPPPPSTDIDEQGWRDAVRMLASDEYEGRRPGTAGEDKTIAYLVERLRKLGLKPGNGASFLQSVPMMEIGQAPGASLTISGPGAREVPVDAGERVIWSRRPDSRAELAHSELVFAGYGIVAPEYAWNDYPADVAGKTVVILAGAPGMAARDPALFKGGAMGRYGLSRYKFEEAARHGASGVLLVHDPATAGCDWQVLVNTRGGVQLAAPDATPRAAIEGWLSGNAARAAFTQAGLDFTALTAAASRPGFKPVPMALYADALVQDTVRHFDSSNVIAVLPGAKRSREYVVYTAHWDGLGRAAGRAGDEIFKGAVDNATGAAGLLMLAQSFVRTHPAPDRSIVFLALTAAESGLLGSAYYAANPIFPLRDTAAVLNLDSLHIGGPSRDVAIFGSGLSELDEYVREAAVLQGREPHPEPNPAQGWYYRSDQFSFAERGVPALFVKAGTDDSARGPHFGQSLIDDYLRLRWHTPGDVYSADWDVRGTLQDLNLYYAVGMSLARTRRFPNWTPGSEFRAARDLSRPPRDAE